MWPETFSAAVFWVMTSFTGAFWPVDSSNIVVLLISSPNGDLNGIDTAHDPPCCDVTGIVDCNVPPRLFSLFAPLCDLAFPQPGLTMSVDRLFAISFRRDSHTTRVLKIGCDRIESDLSINKSSALARLARVLAMAMRRREVKLTKEV